MTKNPIQRLKQQRVDTMFQAVGYEPKLIILAKIFDGLKSGKSCRRSGNDKNQLGGNRLIEVEEIATLWIIHNSPIKQRRKQATNLDFVIFWVI